MAITTANPAPAFMRALQQRDLQHAENVLDGAPDEHVSSAAKSLVSRAAFLDKCAPRFGKPSRVAELHAECEAALQEDDADEMPTSKEHCIGIADKLELVTQQARKMFETAESANERYLQKCAAQQRRAG